MASTDFLKKEEKCTFYNITLYYNCEREKSAMFIF